MRNILLLSWYISSTFGYVYTTLNIAGNCLLSFDTFTGTASVVVRGWWSRNRYMQKSPQLKVCVTTRLWEVEKERKKDKEIEREQENKLLNIISQIWIGPYSKFVYTTVTPKRVPIFKVWRQRLNIPVSFTISCRINYSWRSFQKTISIYYTLTQRLMGPAVGSFCLVIAT